MGNEVINDSLNTTYCSECNINFDNLNGVNLGGPIVPGLDIDETKLPQFKDTCYRQCSNCGEHFNKHSHQALEGYNFRIGF